MASMEGHDNPLRVEPVQRLLTSAKILNKSLQQICAKEGLNKTGVKADFQNRIIGRLQEYSINGDTDRFNRLKGMIENPSSIQPTSQYGSMASSSSPAAAATPPRFGNGSIGAQMGSSKHRVNGHAGLEFKQSPFYNLHQQIGDTKECMTMTAHRHTVAIPVKPADNPILSRVPNDPSFRVMVFCAAEGSGKQDIAFPHQSEIKVNGGEVKANLRGLKSKPGSTRPVDITKELRLNVPGYINNVELTYALTNKKFYLSIYVVKVVPVGGLVKQLEIGQRITKEKVVNEMLNKARDADIVATASVLSLKCPLSTLRIDLPCRSISCKHNQCFDATSYLQLQEQGPTWLCPICNNSAPFDSLAVDEYVKDILKNTSRTVDQVTIQPNGVWELHNKPNNTSRLNGVASDDDDDLIEITKSGDSVKMGTPRANGVENGRPISGQSQSREPSSSVAPRSSVSLKRPPPVMIDLTSSGDEDDEPYQPPAKRQMSQFSGSGFDFFT